MSEKEYNCLLPKSYSACGMRMTLSEINELHDTLVQLRKKIEADKKPETKPRMGDVGKTRFGNNVAYDGEKWRWLVGGNVGEDIGSCVPVRTLFNVLDLLAQGEIVIGMSVLEAEDINSAFCPHKVVARTVAALAHYKEGKGND